MVRAFPMAEEPERFVYDALGRDVEAGSLADENGVANAKTRAWLSNAASRIENFVSGLEVAKLTPADLVAAGAWPPTFSWEVIENAARDYRVALDSGLQAIDLGATRPEVETFLSLLRSSGGDLLRFVELAMRIRRDLSEDFDLQTLAMRLRRYVNVADIAVGRRIELPGVTTRDNARRVSAYGPVLAELKKIIEEGEIPDLGEISKQQWAAWGRRVATFLGLGEGAPDAPIAYPDLLLAADDGEPSTFFRADLREMSAADWSRVCLVCAERLDKPTGGPHAWLATAALLALRFRRERIAALAESLLKEVDDNQAALLSRLVKADSSLKTRAKACSRSWSTRTPRRLPKSAIGPIFWWSAPSLRSIRKPCRC